MNKYLRVGEAAEMLGVSASTLRRWEREGTLVPERTRGNQRLYNRIHLRRYQKKLEHQSKQTIAYARVSSHDQKGDLERQKLVLESYCASQGWQYETIADLGSGMNYEKRGLKKLLALILDGDIERLVICHKDRLLRFGSELVFALCAHKEIEVVIINKGNEPSFEEELAQDVLEIITVFSARLYGSRSRKNKNLLDGLKKAADAFSS